MTMVQVEPAHEQPGADQRRRAPSGTSPARRVIRTGFIVTAVALVAATFTYPFLWLISASLKPRYQVFDNLLIPREVQPQNYTSLLDAVPFLTWFGNSMIVGVMAALTVTLSSALVAFGFAYFRFPGRNLLFLLVLGTMMLPAAVTMIPTFLIWQELGLSQTQVPLWAHNVFASAFYVFLMRQFFLSLPRDTFEAARVDGCGYFGLFWRIAMPLCKPALIVVFIFEFRASWTDLIRPLIYLQDEALYTLPRGLKAVLDAFGQGGEQRWEIVMAASVLATVPLIILFFCAQRYFVEGIATQGRKG
ncbi:carbohydrate ABC transporter permease [Jiangella rhizosphaerae]|nr:carbohydrate ABC transporter permease [Jiangella rhizosphaerae]